MSSSHFLSSAPTFFRASSFSLPRYISTTPSYFIMENVLLMFLKIKIVQLALLNFLLLLWDLNKRISRNLLRTPHRVLIFPFIQFFLSHEKLFCCPWLISVQWCFFPLVAIACEPRLTTIYMPALSEIGTVFPLCWSHWFVVIALLRFHGVCYFLINARFFKKKKLLFKYFKKYIKNTWTIGFSTGNRMTHPEVTM